MTWWWKSLFRKRALDAQLTSEVRFHIEELTDANVPAIVEICQGIHCSHAYIGFLRPLGKLQNQLGLARSPILAEFQRGQRRHPHGHARVTKKIERRRGIKVDRLAQGLYLRQIAARG